MASQRDLAMDDLRDADVLEAYAQGRLAFRPGLGPIHCPHCTRSVGLLLPGNALGRTATARTLLVICSGESDRAAIESGDVVVVVPKIRKVSSDDRKRAKRLKVKVYDDCVEEARAMLDGQKRSKQKSR